MTMLLHIFAKVDLAVKSVFAFDQISPNPIAYISITTNNVFQPVDLTLGLPAALAPSSSDGRLNFYIKPGSNPTVATGFFDTNLKPIPVYLPGEMTLITAEAYARKDNLPQAVIELNKVLTKTAAGDTYGIGANLPPYAGALTKPAILTEIYRNRCIEMYMSSLKLEDSRRFDRPVPELLVQKETVIGIRIQILKETITRIHHQILQYKIY